MGTSSLRVASADALRGPCRGVNQTRVPLGGHRAEAIAAPPSARLLAQPRNLPRRARACDRKGRLLRRKPPRGGRFPALLLFGSEGNTTHYWKGSAQHQSAGPIYFLAPASLSQPNPSYPEPQTDLWNAPSLPVPSFFIQGLHNFLPITPFSDQSPRQMELLCVPQTLPLCLSSQHSLHRESPDSKSTK